MPRFALPSRSTLLGAVIIAAVGLALVAFRLGNPLARLSYDVPFRFKRAYAPPEVIMVRGVRQRKC